ncbi:hypothetical protein B8W67_19910, partial [Mycolicibacillus koreensis]
MRNPSADRPVTGGVDTAGDTAAGTGATAPTTPGAPWRPVSDSGSCFLSSLGLDSDGDAAAGCACGCGACWGCCCCGGCCGCCIAAGVEEGVSGLSDDDDGDDLLVPGLEPGTAPGAEPGVEPGAEADGAVAGEGELELG